METRTNTELPKLHSFKLTDQEAALVMALRTEGAETREALESIFKLAVFEHPDPLDMNQKEEAQQVFELLQIFQGQLGRFTHLIDELNDADQDQSNSSLTEAGILNLPQMRGFIAFVSTILLRMKPIADNNDIYDYPEAYKLQMTRQQYEDACAIVSMHGNLNT